MVTPPTADPAEVLLFPGAIGGLHWRGVAIDRDRSLIVSNHRRLPNRVTLPPRAAERNPPVGDGGARPDQAMAPHAGTPWGVPLPIWLSPLEAPCIAPLWGYIAGTDLATGALLWSKPPGAGRDAGSLGMPSHHEFPLGAANVDGPLATATGLTFIAAARDNMLRAFETATGRLLWRGRLPAGGQASPIPYMRERRRYVFIVATGRQRLETTGGAYIVAFALEEQEALLRPLLSARFGAS